MRITLHERRVSDNKRRPCGYVEYVRLTDGTSLVAGDAGWTSIKETQMYGTTNVYYTYDVGARRATALGIHYWTQTSGPYGPITLECTSGCIQCVRTKALRLDPLKG